MGSIKNTIIVFISMVFGGILKLLYTLMGSQFLGVDTFASLLIGLSLTTLLVSLSMAGCQIGVVRFLQLHDSDHDYKSIVFWGFSVVLLISSISGVLLHYSSSFIAEKYDSSELGVVLSTLSIAIPFLALSEFGSFVYRANGRHTHEILARVVMPQLIVFSTVIAGYYFLSADGVVRFLAFSWTVLGLVVTVFILKDLRFKFALQRPLRMPWSFFRFSFPLSIMPFANRLNAEFYILLIGFVAESKSVILFALALRLAGQISIVPKAINTVMQRKIAKQYTDKDFDVLGATYEKLARYALCTTTPVLIAIVWFYPFIAQYVEIPTVDGLLVVLLILVANYIHTSLGVNGMMLRMGGWSSVDFKITITEIILTVFVGLYLSYLLGVIGIGISYLFVKIVVNTCRLVWVYNLTGLTPFSKRYLKTALISVVALIIVSIKAFLAFSFIYESVVFFSLFSCLICFYSFWSFTSDEKHRLGKLIMNYKAP